MVIAVGLQLKSFFCLKKKKNVACTGIFLGNIPSAYKQHLAQKRVCWCVRNCEKQADAVGKISVIYFFFFFSRDLVTFLTKTSSVSVSLGEINAT